jgi:hypothetical protein
MREDSRCLSLVDFCVIPSAAEGPRIFLSARRCTPNHGASDLLFASFQSASKTLNRAGVEGALAGTEKDPGSLGYARDDTKTG